MKYEGIATFTFVVGTKKKKVYKAGALYSTTNKASFDSLIKSGRIVEKAPAKKVSKKTTKKGKK